MPQLSSKARKSWVLALASLASCMVALNSLVVRPTALSTIRRDLGASMRILEWTVNAYNLTFAVLHCCSSALRLASVMGGAGCSSPAFCCLRSLRLHVHWRATPTS